MLIGSCGEQHLVNGSDAKSEFINEAELRSLALYLLR